MSVYEYIRIKPDTRKLWDSAKIKIQAQLDQELTHDEFAQLVLQYLVSPEELKPIIEALGQKFADMTPEKAIRYLVAHYQDVNA